MGSPTTAVLTAVQLLNDAGITAALKTPEPRPRAGFVKVIMLAGQDRTEHGVTLAQPLELEAWHQIPSRAIELADRALGVLLGAVGTHGIRSASVEAHISELPTGEPGWERYRCTVALVFRQVRERIV